MGLWKRGAIRPYLSPQIADELIRVLAYPKFALTEVEIGFLLRQEVLPFFEIITYGTGVPGPREPGGRLWCDP